MPTDEDTKVFDVARPSLARTNDASHLAVAEHQPQVGVPELGSTPIHVAMGDEDESQVIAHSTPVEKPSIAEGNSEDFSSLTPEHQEYTPVESLIHSDSYDPHPQQTFTPQTNHDGEWPETPPLPTARGAGPRRRWTKILGLLLVALILVVVGGYLAIDAGLIKSNIKLPFHIFNQQKSSSPKTATSSAPAAAPSKPAPAAPSVPTGFTAYTLTGTSFSFDYPTAWGAPVVKTDPGFSKRSVTGTTDGTYAYQVNFATNKDVQAVFTSSKYLPTTRALLYYDYLQWCVGTNDGKFYKQTLHFTTTAGVDTPSTVTCDQGPLADATKIDNQTIVQLKTKDAAGAVLGDLYTQNLTDGDLVVLHVKDAAMTNATNIKTLLTTVKTSSTSSTN